MPTRNKNAPKKLTVVIPTFNEVENIRIIVEKIELTLSPKDFKVLFVDDNSDDGNNSVYENDTPKSVVSSTPSFRSDRRLVRLLIARAFADVLQRAYLKDNDTNRER